MLQHNSAEHSCWNMQARARVQAQRYVSWFSLIWKNAASS